MTGSDASAALIPASPTTARPRRVGLLGGSFDPVHQAHLALGRCALEQLQLDEVRFIPVGQAWQKSRALCPAEHRRAMLALALADVGNPRLVLDDCELQRSGPSYMVDTVQVLSERPDAQAHPTRWFLLIGQDQLDNLPTWHRWQELLAQVSLVVAARPPRHLDVPDSVQATGVSIELLEWPATDLSSTAVRARLAHGEPASHLVPHLLPGVVAGYIDNHQLFAPGNPR